jgi:NitT/TauT family transport system ATP-binding protein
MTMASKLTIRDLGKDYPGQGGEGPLTVLDRIDLDVPTGAFVSIVGLNGSGKTTLLRIIAGLEPASRGSVRVNGRESGSCRGGDIGMVCQELALLPWRTVLKNIEIGLEIKGLAPKERTALAMDYIRTFGLEGFESKYPRELSGGMRQKAAIARTLVTGPALVLMDEPFSALDCQTRNNLQVFLLNVWSRRKDTVLFITHNIEEAVFLSDAIVVISQKPARVLEIIPVDIPRPRDRTGGENNSLRRYVLTLLRDISELSS